MLPSGSRYISCHRAPWYAHRRYHWRRHHLARWSTGSLVCGRQHSYLKVYKIIPNNLTDQMLTDFLSFVLAQTIQSFVVVDFVVMVYRNSFLVIVGIGIFTTKRWFSSPVPSQSALSLVRSEELIAIITLVRSYCAWRDLGFARQRDPGVWRHRWVSTPAFTCDQRNLN